MLVHANPSKMVRLESAPIKVLIIEGHPAVRDALRKRLSATPQLEIIETLGDVSAAVSWMEHDDSPPTHAAPDVIVLGLQNSKDQDLIEILREVRRLARHPAAVVVLAGYADEVERALLQTAGVKRYLLKQINSQQLIREIEKAALELHAGAA